MSSRAMRRLQARASLKAANSRSITGKIPPPAAAAMADDAVTKVGAMLAEELERRGLDRAESAATLAGAALRYYVALAIGLDKLSVAREFSREGSHAALDTLWDEGEAEWARQAPNVKKGGT